MGQSFHIQLLGLSESISETEQAGICEVSMERYPACSALDEKEWLDAWDTAGDMRPF